MLTENVSRGNRSKIDGGGSEEVARGTREEGKDARQGDQASNRDRSRESRGEGQGGDEEGQVERLAEEASC